jgi:hypothetical protein
VSPLSVSAATAVLCFAAFIVTHLSWAHASGSRRYGTIIIRCFIGCLVAAIVLSTVAQGHLVPSAAREWLLVPAMAVFLLACAFILYMPFVFVISSSLSIDTLLLMQRNGGAMSRAALYDRFASTEAAGRRFEIMRGNGMVSAQDGHYRLTAKAARTAHFFAGVKHLWKLWPGG